MKLYSFQQRALAWLKTRDKAFLALDQGLGKTCVSLNDAMGKVLVVCPASLKLNWAKEVKLWRPELTSHVIRKVADDIDTTADVIIVNYDILHKVVSRLPKPDTLILDECHYCKTPTTTRTKTSIALIKKVKRVRLLSGTPVLNRPIEIFPLVKAIDAVKMDWKTFAYRYCAAWNTPWGTFDTSGYSNLEELYEKLSNVMFRLKKETALPELPRKTYRVVELDVDLDVREKKLLKTDIEKSDHVVSFEAISDILKLNAQRKLPMAIQFIKDALYTEEKIVIFAWHTQIIQELTEALKEYDPQVITGSTSLTKRDEAVVNFQSGSSRVFIGNIKAAGTGLTLTAASRVVFVETTWSPGDIEQAADRCHRIGQTEHVQVDILVAHKSIDAQQLHTVIDKMNVISKLVQENEMNKLEQLLDNIIAQAQEAKSLLVEQSEPEQKKEPVPKQIKLDDVRSAAAAVIKAKGESVVVELLAKYNVKKLSELSKDDLASIYKELQ